jgi:16S rRNA (cytidine1402-2'-O)-methyltransferase
MSRARRPASSKSAEPSTTFTVDGAPITAPPLSSGLYVVATPIGNLADVTLRALATLAAADLIACEDTRVTGVLTARYAIATPLIAYHDHNAERQRPKLLAALASGQAVALVSDAGTPLVSDPGYRLVNAARAAGHTITPVPGASAVLTALVASGLPTDAFMFVGYLPTKTAARRKRLGQLAGTPATLIVFESPRRLSASLADMAAELGGARPAAVARELTKAFETLKTGTIASLADDYRDMVPKGEIVVVVGPPQAREPEADEVDAVLEALLQDRPLREAAAEAARQTGVSRRTLYQRALAMKKDADDGAA